MDRLSPHRELLFYLFREAGGRTSLHQLYLQLKREIPISKDTIYGEVERLEKRGIIYPVPKWGSPNAPKKYFLYVPSFIRLVGGNSFPNLLANFYYFHRLRGREVFYREGLTFYLPEESTGIIVTSFPNWRELTKLISKLRGVSKVEIWSYQKGEIRQEKIGKIGVSIFPLDSLFIEE
jgi:predicted AAA+ superfamily ATPase